MAGKVWRDHGALEYIECVADQLTSKHEGMMDPANMPFDMSRMAWAATPCYVFAT